MKPRMSRETGQCPADAMVGGVMNNTHSLVSSPDSSESKRAFIKLVTTNLNAEK